MQDVFKYLKKADTLIKESAADDARELGLEYAGYGRWKDPKTGQITHKSEKLGQGQTKLVQLTQPEQPKQDQQPQQPKTLSDFRKEAPKPDKELSQDTTSVADQSGRVVPGGPDETALASGDVKTVAKMMSRGRGNVQSPTRKRQIAQQSQQQIDQYNSEMDALAAAEAEQEVAAQAELEREMGTPEGRVKEPDEFKSLNQAVEETGRNLDGSERRGDVDISTEESIKRVSDISNTGVDDVRFDAGRKAQQDFLSHYSKDSEYRDGLNTLSKSVAKANDRSKVNEMMDAINSGDYLRTINLKKGTDVSVSQLLLDAGIDVNDEDQVKSFAKAYEEISSFIGEDGNWKRGESHELVGSNLGYYESKHIAERNDLNELDPSGVQTKAFNLSSENQSPFSGLDPVVTDAVFSILPTPSRDFLSKSGSPKTFYNPTEKNQQGKTANPIRGSAALHMWAMQDGRDAYALSGQRRSPGEFQVEHITPLKAGGSDHIDNFGMLLRRVNEPRADLSFDKFLEQAKRKRDSVDSDLSSPVVRQRFERGYRSSSFNSELAPVMGTAVSSLTSKDILNNVNSDLESKLGKQSSAGLKITPENWSNYTNEVNGFMEKNNLPSDTQVKDMNSDQINGLFDIMSENLGVDKAKMNEYMGRNLFNNYDTGARFVINKDGQLEKGRGGTSPTSGAILNMQNSIVSDNSLSPEDKVIAIQKTNEQHQKLKVSRNNYIDNPEDPQAYENYLTDVVDQINFLTGEGDSPLKKGRQYDTRLTYSDKNNIDNDTSNGIMSLLSLDTASVSGGKDAFSPAFQKVPLTPKSKELIQSLKDKMISSYVNTTGFSENEIMNPDSLTKTKRKKIEPLINALENIDRGLAS